MRRTRGRNPSRNFGHIGANDSPQRMCGDCGHKYNPYKFQKCPACHDLYPDSDE